MNGMDTMTNSKATRTKYLFCLFIIFILYNCNSGPNNNESYDEMRDRIKLEYKTKRDKEFMKNKLKFNLINTKYKNNSIAVDKIFFGMNEKDWETLNKIYYRNNIILYNYKFYIQVEFYQDSLCLIRLKAFGSTGLLKKEDDQDKNLLSPDVNPFYELLLKKYEAPYNNTSAECNWINGIKKISLNNFYGEENRNESYYRPIIGFELVYEYLPLSQKIKNEIDVKNQNLKDSIYNERMKVIRKL